MKLLIGFFLGLAVASAMAAEPSIIDQLKVTAGQVVMAAGVGPDDKMAPIRVDDEGHVICSTK